MQDKETTNQSELTDVLRAPPKGRLLSLDIGMKRIGIAVSDELQFTVRHVCVLERKSWKKVLKQIIAYLEEFDAVGLVLGLPYNFDGSESEMTKEARRLARNFSLSLDVPVFLQDERVSTYEARGNLWKRGLSEKEMRERVDSEAAAIILGDFIEVRNQMLNSGERLVKNGG
ncbi:Holliday junction resolvase RuvX [soil metagenome]|nr:Holliday junction resolvase RuvX [Acidobacteriota bacterium]